MKPLLELASFLYGIVTRVRNLLFDNGVLRIYCSKIPVVSVGNITVGGSGKTPLVRYLIKYLKSKGCTPVVLSRGYGGTTSGPLLVDNKLHSPQQVGDEPFMLAADGESTVVVSRSRVLGARFIEKGRLGDIIVLDDGLQHRWLARTVNIVTIDLSTDKACHDFLGGQLLPSGKFRERRALALKRADLIILNFRGPARTSEAVNLLIESLPAIPTVSAVATIRSLNALGIESIDAVKKDVFLIAAIANPEGFIATVKNSGFTVIGVELFSDHYQFTADDISRVRKLAGVYPILCTEKDGVKITGLQCPNFFSVSIDLVVRDFKTLEDVLAPAIDSAGLIRG